MRQSTPARPRWLPWAQFAWVVIVALTLLMYAAGTILYGQQLSQICKAAAEVCGELDLVTPADAEQLAARGVSLEAYALLRSGIRVILGLIPIGLGILIFVRRRDEPMALLVSFFLATFGTAGEATSALAAAYPALTTPVYLIEAVSSGIMLPLFFGLFPNGRMVPRLYWAVVVYFGAGYLLNIDVDSPLGMFWSWTGWLSVLLGGVAAQIYRYRRVSSPVERQQTRWVLFGLGTMAIMLSTLLIYFAIIGDLTIGTTADPDLPRRFVFLVLLNLAFNAVYLSIGLAILRSKLFDIDVIIRKTLIYTVITAMLALVYFGVVILLQGIFESVSGQQAPLSIVISTLIIAALFAPLRRRVQDFIDRRFYRRRYDAEKTLAAFAYFLRDETDLEKLAAELQRVVKDTMQPEQATIWLKEVKR